MFKFKDTVPSYIRSLVIYKFKCSGCNATYIGKTKRYHEIRMCEHLGISWRTGVPTKYNEKTTTAIRDHIRETGHENSYENFEILNFGTNNFACLVKENILIDKFAPTLINKQVNNFKLSLFQASYCVYCIYILLFLFTYFFFDNVISNGVFCTF